MNIRAEILDKAKQCICHDREDQYGSPENNFKAIANLWNAYLENKYPYDPEKPYGTPELTPTDVALMMALMKIARIQSGIFKRDSFVDAAGYLACAGEVAGVKFEETEDCFSPGLHVLKGELL